MQAIIDAAAPHALEMLGLALTGIITWAAAKARAKWGIDIEARHREALHSALMTGARLALAGNLSRDAAIQMVLAHVRASVPDALRALLPSGPTLRGLAEAKLAEVHADLDLEQIAGDAMAKALQNALAVSRG